MSTIAAGTTSTTALVNTGDTTGNLVFQTNGTTTAMTIDTSQNVGIGTSSPVNKLSVSNAGANGLEVAPAGTNSGTNILSVNRSTSSFTTLNYYANDHRFYYGASNTEGLRLDSSGNVGIGTSSPGAKLDVNGSIKAVPSLATAGIFVIASASYNNSSVNTVVVGNMAESHTVINIVTGGNKVSSIPIYPNGGSGIAYVYNYMNPATGGWTNTGGSDINFSFSCAGSNPNTYNVIVTSGSGTLTVQRTGGTASYAVYVQRFVAP